MAEPTINLRMDTLAARPSLSLAQIDWLDGVIAVARAHTQWLYDDHDTEATLCALRVELTKEALCRD